MTTTAKLATNFAARLDAAMAKHRMSAVNYNADYTSGRISRDYVTDQLKNTGLDNTLNDLRQEAEDNATAARAAYDKALKDVSTITTSTDPTTALLAETRATKIWQRLERHMSQKNINAATHLRERLEQGDALERAVILTEGPSYLASRGSVADLTASLYAYIPELGEAESNTRKADAYRLTVESNLGKVATANQQNITNPPASTSQLKRYLDPVEIISE